MKVAFDKAVVGIYSYRKGAPGIEPQFEFDLEKFRDPIGNQHLKALAKDGCDQVIQDWIKDDPRMPALLDQCLLLAEDRITHGGFKWLSIGFTDYHGKWISRAVAELVATHLAQKFSVGVKHGPTT